MDHHNYVMTCINSRYLPEHFQRRQFLRMVGALFYAGSTLRIPASVDFGKSVLDDASLQELKRCHEERKRIVSEAVVPLDRLTSQYKAALVTLKNQLQTQGKLDAVLAVEAEVRSLSSGVGVQSEAADMEIAKLQRVYSSRLDALATPYREAILKAESFYGKSLDSLAKSWTKIGRIDAAAAMSKMAVESNKRAILIKDMISKRTNYLNLCNPDICQIVSAPENDGKPQYEFGRSLTREEEIEFRDVIWAPSNKETKTIISVNVPPGFNAVSFVGVGSFDGYIWSRVLSYSVEADGKIIATFGSDKTHWPRILFLPSATTEIRLITTGNFNGGGAESYWAWPRLHTGLRSVAASTGWPKNLPVNKS